MRNNHKIILTIFALLLVGCKKNSQIAKPSIKELTNLKNYKIQRTKVNDTIDKVFGESENETISGNINTKTQRKDGWWKVSSKKSNNFIEIEYLDVKPENFNQLKFYENGKLINSMSSFYEIKKQKNIFKFFAYFPLDEKAKQSANLHIIIYDTIKRKVIEEKKFELSKKGNSYSTNFENNNSNSVIFGSINEFTTSSLKNDSIKMETQTIYFMEK